MNSKTFVVIGSFALLLWLGLSFFTEIKPSYSPVTPAVAAKETNLPELVSNKNDSASVVDDAAP